jgi:hypothetical protein
MIGPKSRSTTVVPFCPPLVQSIASRHSQKHVAPVGSIWNTSGSSLETLKGKSTAGTSSPVAIRASACGKFELKRLDQAVTMTGNNWSTLATCPKNPKHQTSIVVTDGRVDASLLRYKEEGEPEGDAGAQSGIEGGSNG